VTMNSRIGFAVLLCAQNALAQCSMCRNAAAAQGAQSAVLDSAILVLFLPAVTLFGLIVFVTVRLGTRGTAHGSDVESTKVMSGESQKAIDEWLERFLQTQGAVSGTVHINENGTLKLAAAVNIPEKVREIVAIVPNGKGMAGLALQRGEPVHTCNLKEDASGSVKPGAKAVDAQAAVAIPVRTEAGAIHAVVGIAFHDARDWSEEDLSSLTRAASGMPLL
jgi:L-methionine (R)-S-oxide reductase